MLDKLFDRFQGLFAESQQEKTTSDETVHLAMVALLLEVARSSEDKSAAEIETIHHLLEKLDLADNANELLSAASEKVEAAHDLYQFTQVINDQFGYNEKSELIFKMWRVAYADGEIEAIEDHIIRRIAGLLHVSHQDFIKQKIRAREAN